MTDSNIFSELISDNDLSDIKFPITHYHNLLANLELPINEFIAEWGCINYKIEDINNSKINLDWILALCFPLISYSIRNFEKDSKPLIIGISALPGTGKSTLGRVLENIAKIRKFPIDVISIDDFYFPAEQLDQSMLGNPWDVPRGLPGSHSLDEMHHALDKYINSGELIVPRFDKSLRNGCGDRSGSYSSTPKALIIEGWFLGCTPLNRTSDEKYILNENISPKLSTAEIDYRIHIQDSLSSYLPIWSKISKLWHIRAQELSFTSTWKTEQETNMLNTKGSALSGNKLKSFIRMLCSSIPQTSLQNIHSDITLHINLHRQIKSIITSSMK